MREIDKGPEDYFPLSPFQREEIVPEYQRMRIKLQSLYDKSGVKRNEASREECRSGRNFAMTLGLVIDRTKSPEMACLVNKILEHIVDFPTAGTISWEMRRFIRWAHEKYIPEFLYLVEECVEKDGRVDLDMDFFVMDRRNIDDVFEGFLQLSHPQNN